ncbi:small ribosomal subunit protein mS35 isoform 2-T2 [Pangshura tecta]
MAGASGCLFCAGPMLPRLCAGLAAGPRSLFRASAYSTALLVGSGGPSPGEVAASRRGRTSQNARNRRVVGAPRTEKMAVDQYWGNVYPTAAAFNPSSVPLPIRMGYPVKRGAPPPKEGNLELIKIPNFLHLTPPAIKKHCTALKDFCTEWPAVLDSDEKCEQHFPIEIETVDYVSAGPSVRNPKARVVTLRVKLSKLNLDDHAKKKLIKLVGERYCKDTDILTIITDRCPLRRQNYDYGIYLLTVLYHESWVVMQDLKTQCSTCCLRAWLHWRVAVLVVGLQRCNLHAVHTCKAVLLLCLGYNYLSAGDAVLPCQRGHQQHCNWPPEFSHNAFN